MDSNTQQTAIKAQKQTPVQDQQRKSTSAQKQTKQIEQNALLQSLKLQIKDLSTNINSLLAENEDDIHINGQIKKLLVLQTKFHNIKDLFVEEQGKQQKPQQQQTTQSAMTKAKEMSQQSLKKQTSCSSQAVFADKIAIITKQAEMYEPTMQQIEERKQTFQEEMNDDGWTDASQSDAGKFNPDDVMVFDDDMLDQMGIGFGEEENQNENKSQQQEEDQVDIEELEEEFVKGGESDAHHVYGQHGDKFCVSIRSISSKGLLVSGGGDDFLNIYRMDDQEKHQKQKQTAKMQQMIEKQGKTTKDCSKFVKRVAHSETITQIQVSFDCENIFSLTEKQLMCTDTSTLESKKVPIDVPRNIVCHRQGGVFATSNGYNVEVYNIKGFKFYDSYCLDEEISLLKWTANGKQLVAACDNKLRIITPKTREVTKATGTAFHNGEITVMEISADTVFTGCIDGQIYATNLSNGMLLQLFLGKILGGTTQLEATIATLCVADNYLMVGPSDGKLYWLQQNKFKKLFENQLKGSSTDIINLYDKNIYAVGDIQGEIHIFDKRNPLKPKLTLKAGNSVHQLFHEKKILYAACEDGRVRSWDLAKFDL